jgi:hypothetical protein
MFGRNLHDTNQTNSVIEIRLALYCRMFEGINYSLFNVDEVLSLRVVTPFIFNYLQFCIFQCRYLHTHSMQHSSLEKITGLQLVKKFPSFY